MSRGWRQNEKGEDVPFDDDFPSDGAIYAAISDKLQLKEMAAKDAEIARLREALRQISEIELQEYGPDWAEIEQAQTIATAALGHQQK